MAEELELDLDENINKTEERIKDLSAKTKLAYQERDAEKAARETLEADKSKIEKERDFFASFSDQVAKYPGASEFKDAIKEKVLAGYTTDDATVAVLAANNKLMPQTPAPVVQANVAGGSATNTMTDVSTKSVAEMTQAERRAELVKAENRGELGLS